MKKKLLVSLMTFMLVLMCWQICAFASQGEVSSVSFDISEFNIDCNDDIYLFEHLKFTFTDDNEDNEVDSDDVKYSITCSDGSNCCSFWYEGADYIECNNAGTCVITASVNGYQAKCTVNVSHSYIYSKITKVPTGSEAGERTYECYGCDYEYVESIPKLPKDDVEPPVIDLATSKIDNTVKAGDDIHVSIAASDNLTGIKRIYVTLFNVAYPEKTISEKIENYDQDSFSNKGINLYSDDIYIYSSTLNGEWRLGNIKAYDYTGNYVSVSDKSYPGIEEDDIVKDLSAFSFTVTGGKDSADSADDTAPVVDISSLTITALNSDNRTVTYGDTINVSFKATDEGSEPKYAKCYFEWENNRGDDYISVKMTYDSTSKLMKGSFTVPSNIRIGRYYLDEIYIEDNADNNEFYDYDDDQSKSFVVKASLTDNTPPVIDTSSLEAEYDSDDGEIRISVKVTDDDTGVDNDSVEATYINADSKERKTIYLDCNDDDLDIYSGSDRIEDSGENDNDSDYESGEWKLYSISASDKNGNEVVIYDSNQENGSDGKKVYDFSKGYFTISDNGYYKIDNASLSVDKDRYTYGETVNYKVKITSIDENESPDKVVLKYLKPDGQTFSKDLYYDEDTGYYSAETYLSMYTGEYKTGVYQLNKIIVSDDNGNRTTVTEGLSSGDYTVYYDGVSGIKFENAKLNTSCNDEIHIDCKQHDEVDLIYVSLKGNEDNWMEWEEYNDCPKLTFTSSNEKVAFVDCDEEISIHNEYFVHVLDAGECTITVKADNGVSAALTINASHKWGNRVITKEATETEDGECKYTCLYNKNHKLTKILKADGTETQKETEKETQKETQKETVKETQKETQIESVTETQKETQKETQIETTFLGSPDTISAEVTSKSILTAKTDKDPSGSQFATIQAKLSKASKSSIKISWTAVKGASKYIVFGNKCGKAYKELAQVKAKSYTQKKLTKGTYYKYLVVAVDKNGQTLSVSKTIHTCTLGGKTTDVAKVTTASKKNKVSIKKGKTFSLKAKVVKKAKKLKLKNHRALAYESSNTKIATVSKKGVIKGVGKGTCYVYAYAQNGVYAKVKVTVK